MAQAAGEASSTVNFALERRLLSGITYGEAKKSIFTTGLVHSDASVLPADLQSSLLERYSNFVNVCRTADGQTSIENTFILSSWCPAVQRLRVRKPAMLVTYADRSSAEPGAALHWTQPSSVVAQVSNVRAHPELSPNNQLRALALRVVQGRAGVYYCASSATLANGHDLSLLSGFVVANALGAPYPFRDVPAALRDFELQRALMGL